MVTWYDVVRLGERGRAMGFMRKLFILGTGGAGATVVRPNSKKERTAKNTRKQLKVQREILKEMKGR